MTMRRAGPRCHLSGCPQSGRSSRPFRLRDENTCQHRNHFVSDQTRYAERLIPSLHESFTDAQMSSLSSLQVWTCPSYGMTDRHLPRR